MIVYGTPLCRRLFHQRNKKVGRLDESKELDKTLIFPSVSVREAIQIMDKACCRLIL